MVFGAVRAWLNVFAPTAEKTISKAREHSPEEWTQIQVEAEGRPLTKTFVEEWLKDKVEEPKVCDHEDYVTYEGDVAWRKCRKCDCVTAATGGLVPPRLPPW